MDVLTWQLTGRGMSGGEGRETGVAGDLKEERAPVPVHLRDAVSCYLRLQQDAVGTTPGTLECRSLPLPAPTTKREVQGPTSNRPSPAVPPLVSAASRPRPRLAESGGPRSRLGARAYPWGRGTGWTLSPGPQARPHWAARGLGSELD